MPEECANTGCTDRAEVLVPFVDPAEVETYCKQCGIYEYQRNRTAQGVFDIDADVTPILEDLGEDVKLAGFETMADRMADPSDDAEEFELTGRYHEEPPDDATRTVSGMVRTGPDADDVERVEYVLHEDEDGEDVLDAIRYGTGKSHLTSTDDWAEFMEDDDAP